MRYLNLDRQFQPLGASISFESHFFSGGEPHIRLTEDLRADDELVITTRIQSFNDLGLLLLAVDALRRIEIKNIQLLLPYFPGARQDRTMVIGEALTVKVYADIINKLHLDKVFILDPHSEVTPALLHNVNVIGSTQLVKIALAELNDYVLVAPDAGSVKRVTETARVLQKGHVVQCTKKRDVRTGKLNDFEIMYGDLAGQTCVIVDDICDGGGTFLGIGKKLKEHGAGKLILFVSHGIFSKGTEVLGEVFDQIICTDSFCTLNDPNVRQIQLRTNHINL